ncbi:unnamed protein product [Diamesa serratosioi]
MLGLNGVLSIPIKDSEEVEANKPSCQEGDKTCENESLNNLVEPEIVDPNFQPNEEASNLIERNIIIENENETQYYRGFVEPGSNITTIIRLTNLINNTNIINMPTTLNNTNINNIHLYNNKSSNDGGKYGLGYTKKGQCCFAVKPKACRQTTSGLKCHHKRVKTCGRQCTAKLIHPRRQQKCQWPYMGCSGNNQQYPYYPQQFYPQYPQYPPQRPSYFDEDNYDGNDDGDDEDFPDENDLQSDDWAVTSEKCKFVSEDGVQVTNCTQAGELSNPFARHTADGDDTIKRETRHISKRHYSSPQPYQQQQNYPYQAYFQQMPVYYVPVQAPAPSNYFYPPQYLDNDEDDDSYEALPQVHSKRHPRKKRHHIIEEEDVEL